MSKFNYVYIPVGLGEIKRLHITVKFLGYLDIPPETVAARLSALTRFTPSVLKWRPELFDSKDSKVGVLEITHDDGLLSSMHGCLRDLRREDYPRYRPHITIKESDLWSALSRLQVGDLPIMTGQPMYAYKGQHINLMKLIKEYKNV